MHKYVWRFVAVCVCGSFLASVVCAKVWLLPDYQSGQPFSHRVNGGSNHQRGDVTCSDYGMYASSQITTGMSCSSSAMIKNLKCYGDCSCSSVYKYSSSTCRSAGKIPSGTACMGKYRECICDTSTYPHTSSSCAYTLSGASCYDKYGYHYPSCVNPCAAYSSYTNVSSCSYGCEDVVSSCTSKCRKCYADNCRNRTAVSTPYGCEEYFSDCSSKCKKAYTDNCHNRADNETKLGCEKYWADCPSKCQTGKTCVKSFPEGSASSVTCTESGQTKKTYTSCGETRYKCVCEKTEQTCLTGKNLVNLCTNDAGKKVGDCVDCRDPESTNNPCKGFALCEGDKVGDGKTCDCGGLTYHERCLVPEKCLNGVKYDDTPLGSCGYAYPLGDSWFKDWPYYPVGVKCTQQNGTKLYCSAACSGTQKDLAGNYAPCAGKKECANNDGIGLCECGNKKYFDECNEKCTRDTPYDDTPLGSCGYAYPLGDSWFKDWPYYPVGVKCTQKNGTKLYCSAACSSTQKDLAGNYAPCAGKRECPSGTYALGDLCTCAGKTFGDSCGTVCNYDDTPERCAALGKSFSQKCADSSGNLFGQCI